jgi:hypothetical protein
MNNPFIWTKSNVLSKKFCNDCISKFENDKRKYPGVAGNSFYTPNLKKSTDLDISVFKEWKKEDSVFFESIKDAFTEYSAHINSSLPNHEGVVGIMQSNSIGDSGYLIQRTNPSEFYSWHNDALVIGNRVRTVTFIWYLNTIKKDGYTEFWDGTQINPEQGKLLIFPATWDFIHRGVSPKKETKYICTGWLHYEISTK